MRVTAPCGASRAQMRRREVEPKQVARGRGGLGPSGLAAGKGVGILTGLLQRTVRGVGPSFTAALAGIPRRKVQRKSSLRPGSSVVERGPEKAGVGGSIPSLATITQDPILSARPSYLIIRRLQKASPSPRVALMQFGLAWNPTRRRRHELGTTKVPTHITGFS